MLLVLGTIEATAWLADSVFEYRQRLLLGYRQQEADASIVRPGDETGSPFTRPSDLSNSDPRLFVRPLQPAPVTGKWPAASEVVIGGQEISGAVHDSKQIPLAAPAATSQDSTRRLFVLGGSAAFGYPYPEADSLAARLRSELSHVETRPTEVHNVAYPGWDSSDLVPVARKIAKDFQPDTIILFCGNNEWVHWRAESCRPQSASEDRGDRQGQTAASRAGKSRSGQASEWAQRMLILTANSRSLAGLQFLAWRWQRERLQSAARQAHLARLEATWRLHVELTGFEYALAHPLPSTQFDVALWESDKQARLERFRRNLETIISTFKSSRVILVTMPFNYRLSPAWNQRQPWCSDPSLSHQVETATRRAVAHLDANQSAAALSVLDQHLPTGVLAPVAHHVRGECLARLGRSVDAEHAFARCREQMIGHLGCRLSVNRVMREVARSTGVTLVDARQLFDEAQHKRERYFNSDLVHDDCHPTPAGHALLAREVAKLLRESRR